MERRFAPAVFFSDLWRITLVFVMIWFRVDNESGKRRSNYCWRRGKHRSSMSSSLHSTTKNFSVRQKTTVAFFFVSRWKRQVLVVVVEELVKQRPIVAQIRIRHKPTMTTTKKKSLSTWNQVHVPDGRNDEKQYVRTHRSLPLAAIALFQVAQRDIPGIDASYLAMDTEEGVEVVWNEVLFSERKISEIQHVNAVDAFLPHPCSLFMLRRIKWAKCLINWLN